MLDLSSIAYISKYKYCRKNARVRFKDVPGMISTYIIYMNECIQFIDNL